MRFALFALPLLFLVACGTAPTPTGPGQGAPKRAIVQFYLVREEPGPNVVEYKVGATSETIFLAQKPDLTNRDIAWAEMQMDPITGRASVLVHLTLEGREKLALLTGRNAGRRLAIAVDGRIISTPLITKELRDGRATIQGFRSAAEAQRVADSLNFR
jgi:preprotein translocase subunit SecD